MRGSLQYVVLAAFLAALACSPAKKQEAAGTQTESSTDTIASTATAGATSGVISETTPAIPTGEEKPMSEYQDKVAELHTTLGEIDIRFFPDVAPNHVRNFIDLAGRGFYNGTKFHRVIPGFMIQGGDPNTVSGDPNSWGTGGSPNRLKSEFNRVHHKRGIVSMARSNHPDSASSQFFICVADVFQLDNQYTVFGQVTKGMDVVDKIVKAPRNQQNDRPNDPVAIQSVTIRDATDAEKGPTPK